jgi:hypothetical protein
MSVEYYAKLILGMTVSRDDFFKPTGSKRQCIGCLKDYPTDSYPKHCPDCGQKVLLVKVEEPTPALQKYAEEKGYDVDELWEELVNERDSDKIGIHPIDPNQSSETAEDNIVLGFLLSNIDSYQEKRKKDNSLDLAEVPDLVIRIHMLASELDIPPRATKVYSCLYCSF